MQEESIFSIVDYSPVTGIFTCKVARGNKKAGTVIGNLCKKGYLKAMISGKYVKLHRLAWFYTHGFWPDGEIDHINQIKTDNRICNLRVCTTSENCLNQTKPRKNNSLGIQGVHRIAKTGRYRAACTVKGVKHHLGVFSTTTEAAEAYKSFKQRYLP